MIEVETVESGHHIILQRHGSSMVHTGWVSPYHRRRWPRSRVWQNNLSQLE
jgi:hypothetical protein